jgi:hypothetical protein
MDELTQHRKKRLEQLINGAPYNGDRASFMRHAGLTKGRISQLLDPGEQFGELAAERLAARLGLPDARWFDMGAPGAPNVWPFVLITPEQVLSLSARDREMVEYLALRLIHGAQTPDRNTNDSSNNAPLVSSDGTVTWKLPLETKLARRRGNSDTDASKAAKKRSSGGL